MSDRLRNTGADRDVRVRRLGTERNPSHEIRTILHDQGQKPMRRYMGHRARMPNPVNVYAFLQVIPGTGNFRRVMNRERTGIVLRRRSMNGRVLRTDGRDGLRSSSEQEETDRRASRIESVQKYRQLSEADEKDGP